jgi:hypothetical protein
LPRRTVMRRGGKHSLSQALWTTGVLLKLPIPAMQ